MLASSSRILGLSTFLRPLSNVPSKCSQRSMRSLRRKIAEWVSNKFKPERVVALGPDFACLEWLMQCGATKVEMSDGRTIRSISEMKSYVKEFGLDVNHLPKMEVPDRLENAHSSERVSESNILYESRWSEAPKSYIVKVDASDSAIADPGFAFFRECRQIEELILNFCDYFGDDALRELALGRTSHTLKNLEIVMNPAMSDGAVYWLIRLKALRRAHFYFLPYVANRAAVLRQLKLALPKCKVTFPPLGKVGYGYDES